MIAVSAFSIVGVGASAGGLDAFRQLLAYVPADSGLALVLVQHLEATRASLLSDALAQATAMKVTQAEQGARVEPNRVYVVPPGVQIAIEQGVLKVYPLEEDERRPHLPIDFFLRSLAADRGRQAIGVVLSGTVSDGTAGLAAIRAHGGITFAQDPRSARFGEMPQSAVDAGVVDFCLTLPALGAELARLACHPHLARSAQVRPIPTGAASLAHVVALVRATTGVDFGEHDEGSFDQLKASSTNEELATVNDELHGRNQDLQLVNADVLNLLDAVEIPSVMLDAERRVRRFTGRASTFMGLTPADVGRRITDVALLLQAPDLEQWITRAMEEAFLVEAEVQDRSDRWHRLQIRPRRSLNGNVDGAILSLVDIDELRHEVSSAWGARDCARSIVEAVQVPLVVLEAGLRVLSANAAYYRLFHEKPAETEGHGFFELGAGEWDTPELRRAVAAVVGAEGRFQGLGLERAFPGAGHRATSVSGCAIPSRSSEPMILLAIEDVTERREGERRRAELLALAEAARQRAGEDRTTRGGAGW